MAVNLIFSGSEGSYSENHKLECFVTAHNEIFVEICMEDLPASYVCLDKSTAIRFSKELRKQISYLESEVDNG